MKQLYAIILLVATTLVLSWGVAALVRNVIFAATCETEVDHEFIRADVAGHRWQVISRYVFPMYLTLAGHDAGRLQPAFKVNFGWALFISHLLFFAYLFTVGRRGTKRTPLLRLVNATAIILFGVPGLIAVLIIQNAPSSEVKISQIRK
jgi:hypothetical protein